MTPDKQYTAFELSRIIEDIGALCHLEDANTLYISGAIWSPDIGLLTQWQQEIADYRDMLEVFSEPAIPSIYSIEKIIKKIELPGSPFPLENMNDFLIFLNAAGKWARLSVVEKFDFETIFPYANSILPLDDLANRLQKIISDDGEIKDSASTELSAVRKSLNNAKQNLNRESEKALNKYSAYLQESQSSIRSGRIVLPVVDSYFRKVKGIVHGRSASGMTVYVEPQELVDANNEIDAWKNREMQEIYKILVDFADLVRSSRIDILQNWQALCYLDAIGAKVRWMKLKKANVINFNDKGELNFVDAIHPILADRIGHENVIPLNIRLNREKRWVLITGPNAGGKTVALKTIAVNIILAHLGMPVLASGKSNIPVFSKVLFDIGDKQSIADDLSTFSAHLAALRKILDEADSGAFVLIDELGTGTDPAEGAAIAQALLENLLKSACFGVANSHHGALKLFAHEQSGIANASMEFSKSEFKPTYQLLMDVPGSSYALEISRRMSMDEAVLKRAAELLGDERQGTENLILSLQKRLNRTNDLMADLEKEKSRYAALEKLYQQQLENLRKNKDELKQNAVDEAQEIIQKANSLIEKSIKEIKESRAESVIVKKVQKQVEDFKADLSSRKKKEASTLIPPTNVKKGEMLRWVKMDQSGEVIEVLDGKNVLLMVGNVKIKVPLKECQKISRKEAKKTGISIGYTLPKAALEIDLRGKYSDEIGIELEKYFGDAIANDWNTVSIIHGKGTGALQKAVNVFLKQHKKVRKFRPANPSEGGGGVTVVYLK